MANPIISETLTPDFDGMIICMATYSVEQTGTGSDWGSSTPNTVMKVNKVSGGTLLQTGPSQPCSRTRMPQTYRVIFPAFASDGAITVSLNGTGGGAGTRINYYEIDLTVELIKR